MDRTTPLAHPFRLRTPTDQTVRSMSTPAALADPDGLTQAARDLLRGYAQAAGGFDEMIDRQGQVRPHWQAFLNGFAELGRAGRQSAAEATRRHVRESGIAFNVHADPDDRRHAWRLDLAPLLLTERDWRHLADGLVQRARLAEAVLQDLYGRQTLLKEGRIPSRLVLGAAEFARPEAGLEGQRHRFLHTFACDVARTADGSWVVLGDQADADIGAGYVIASRVALSNGLAGLFRACHTRRLAGFYRALQESLQGRLRREGGRIALLSPGPADPCYFSHAYLARYLGYTLCEVGDLTVRDDHLFLKTLDGLQRIDLLLRKVPGAGLDPLFLPGVAAGGIAGLMQVVRGQGLVLANALGSALLQNRTLGLFARGLAPHLLGQELLLADAPGLWLDEAGAGLLADERHAHWRRMKLRGRNDPGAPIGLEDGAGAADPSMMAAPPVELATAPAFEDDRLVPRPFAIRCFMARIGDDWQVLPGGLVRTAGEPASAVLPNGFGSRDLWVTGRAPEMQQLSLLRASIGTVHLRRTGTDLLSRTADNLFWLGRYAERAEGRMRLLRSLLSRLIEDRGDAPDPAIMVRLLAPEGEADAPAPGHDLDDLTYMAMFEGPYALRASLEHLHRTATLVRDQISHDAWRTLNGLWLDRAWRDTGRAVVSLATLDLLDGGIRTLNAFAGTEAENMTRNFAWRFLSLGRRIERAFAMADLIARLTHGATPGLDEGDQTLRLLLELGDSFMTYRSRYLMTPLPAPVLDLLVLDETNPRSIAYQLAQIEHHLAAMPQEGPHRSTEHRLILKLLTQLRLLTLDDLVRQDENGRRPQLDQVIADLEAGLPALSDLINHSHVAHAEMPAALLP